MLCSEIPECSDIRQLSPGSLRVLYVKVGRPAPFATSYMIGREDKRTNNRTMHPALKHNADCRLSGSIENRALKGAGVHEVSYYFRNIVTLDRM